MNLPLSHSRLVRRMFSAVLMTLAFTLPVAALDLGPLKGEVFGQGNRNLVVVLHGDSGPGNGRMSAFARTIAAQAPGSTVVALTRPGFNGKGGRSPGENSSKDHYTKRNNQLVAQSLSAMRKALKPGRTIVVGHSGGAAQTAIVNGSYPGLIDVAILAGCPCNVPAWRVSRRGSNNWTQSQSPHDFAQGLRKGSTVILLTNARDTNTLPRFAEEYAALAKKAGARVTLQIPSGGGHNFSNYEGRTLGLVKQVLK
ncbi:alpha/beta hydrolase [Pseudooceanicola sp.]|uniref:alpha/beta hydrolase family protein n=1 Tax=Pseudooceanicola sp. TaxID=1914328 RepID=UPI00260EA67A|nr:alpha/beta hydrolase [Pseudooceanicola sp.]MDF1856896.1 alpha/beta hydrolase [Pseudooceanicola sp.]